MGKRWYRCRVIVIDFSDTQIEDLPWSVGCSGWHEFYDRHSSPGVAARANTNVGLIVSVREFTISSGANDGSSPATSSSFDSPESSKHTNLAPYVVAAQPTIL